LILLNSVFFVFVNIKRFETNKKSNKSMEPMDCTDWIKLVQVAEAVHDKISHYFTSLTQLDSYTGYVNKQKP
jgi:hypothetical protein